MAIVASGESNERPMMILGPQRRQWQRRLALQNLDNVLNNLALAKQLVVPARREVTSVFLLQITRP
jgi:hypothetical protein